MKFEINTGQPHGKVPDALLPKYFNSDHRRIRKEPWGRDMLIVALSGWGQPEDRRRSKKAGFDHHMVKPVRHDELTALLNRHRSAPQETTP